ncbi:alpha/beta hydrolase [Neisseria sp. ZJ106]|uniref:Alpha/beta hydrolase n=1 Tax=Neisseria lisongii TaxID=2912188 RepID=A0ABY7RQE8_9NEIS|nr:alpha/beta hydrolase [Neisseria lisongii]MCF7521891.1 alpha/beta hydrolase [Neisseria lisongii]WCL72470.1 alpha/beta hydrolase [Neisseria lisongii]
MDTYALEDLTLFLVRDAAEPPMWLDRWAASYPQVQITEVSAAQTIAQWQQQIAAAFQAVKGRHIAVVAHGSGVAAWLAWLYQADMLTQKRLCNMILVSPKPETFYQDEVHTLQRVRCPCRTALVIGNSGDCDRQWAQQHADLWRARLLVSPHAGRLDGTLGGWQWGMKLMQEMLLA